MLTVLSIFMAALILAYVLEPIVERLRAIGLNRRLAALAAVLVGIGALASLGLLLINILQRDIPMVRAQAPAWIQSTQLWLAPMLERFEISLNWEEIKAALVDRVTRQFSDNAEVVITRVLDTVLASVQSFIAVVAALVLIFFVVFYLLVEWSSLFSRASEFLPHRHRTTAAALAQECDQLLSQYLRGQLSVMLVLAAYYAIALSLSGMAGAVGIGILTGLAIFIPYIGFGVGLALALISGLLQFGPGSELLIIGLIYAAGQLLESFVLTPTLVGQKIGLHPVAVVFALMFFGSLFGFFGVLLALPAAAITLVGLRFMRRQIEDSSWFSG
ncbi:MAG: AI-2E family transporter [Betaproteobacteria bacterium]|jgi:predicted PurR-regulated permease PerM|nr:AI-2E family transporter [Betaproteobacteria bacterium]